MNAAVLLSKLLDIERTIAHGDFRAVHPMLLEAEDLVLHIQQEFLNTLHENETLRLRLEGMMAASSLIAKDSPPAATKVATIDQMRQASEEFKPRPSIAS